MKAIDLPRTMDTPGVRFEPESGYLHIEGGSYPENALEFYTPIIECLANYISTDGGPLNVNFKMLYFNSSSSSCVLDILDMLEQYAGVGGEVTVNWYYKADDEDIKESGEDFAEDLNLMFNLISFS